MIIPGQSTVSSPCGQGCAYNAVEKMCDSCGRTLEEIGNWSRYSDEEKTKVWNRLNTQWKGKAHANSNMDPST